MVLWGSEDGRVFVKGLRLDHAPPGQSNLRSGVRLPAVELLQLAAAADSSSGNSAATAQELQQHQQEEFLGIHGASQSLLAPAVTFSPAAASAAAEGAVSGGAFVRAGGGSFSSLKVWSCEEACSLSSEEVGVHFRTLLSLMALVLLALKMLLLRDRASRPQKLLLLDFLKTAAACTLLQLLPTSEGALVGGGRGTYPDACETYAAVQLVQAVLWLTLLKLLLRETETLLGCRQGGYVRCSSSSRCCCCCSQTDGDAAAAAAAGAATGGKVLQREVFEVRCLLASPPKVYWLNYGQELVALLLCVAAAQAATALLLLLVSRLSPLLKLPLSLLHGDNARLRRLLVSFVCPLFTDLFQSCSLDKLIRTQPKPCCQRSSCSSNSSSSKCSSSRCRLRRQGEDFFLSD
ncbi:hypothetical protein Esti_005503 [Eimeria stiedai]